MGTHGALSLLCVNGQAGAPQPGKEKVIAVDLQMMAPVQGVRQIQGDITSQETAEQIIDHFDGAKVDLIVSDGAPDVTGLHDIDVFVHAQLMLAAINVTCLLYVFSGCSVLLTTLILRLTPRATMLRMRLLHRLMVAWGPDFGMAGRLWRRFSVGRRSLSSRRSCGCSSQRSTLLSRTAVVLGPSKPSLCVETFTCRRVTLLGC